MRKHSSIFAGMMNIEIFNSEKRSESVAKTVEATLNDLKISIEPSMMEMKNVLLAAGCSETMEKMIEKYSVKPPLNLIDENEFDLYTQGHFNQALCAALMLYHTNCRILVPLKWGYRLIPLAYKLAAEALHAKDLMLLSEKLKREARFYEVQSYSSEKKEFIPRSRPNSYREAITMGMVIYMLKATQRAKNDFLFSHALKCLEQEYSKGARVPSFLPYISHAFCDLVDFVQTCENAPLPLASSDKNETRNTREENVMIEALKQVFRPAYCKVEFICALKRKVNELIKRKSDFRKLYEALYKFSFLKEDMKNQWTPFAQMLLTCEMVDMQKFCLEAEKPLQQLAGSIRQGSKHLPKAFENAIEEIRVESRW